MLNKFYRLNLYAYAYVRVSHRPLELVNHLLDKNESLIDDRNLTCLDSIEQRSELVARVDFISNSYFLYLNSIFYL